MGMSDKIRYYRRHSGMNQTELGQRLGVTAQAVSKWELGKAEPDKASIEKMCALFGVSANELMDIQPSPVVDTSEWDPDDMAWLDKLDKETRILTRGSMRISPENRIKLIEMARLMFGRDFDEEGNKIDDA